MPAILQSGLRLMSQMVRTAIDRLMRRFDFPLPLPKVRMGGQEMQKSIWFGTFVPLVMLVTGCFQPDYDRVINHGRVIDPLSNLDGVRHVGIKDGRIVRISKTPLTGADEIDASGLVVAPGFIDYHFHCPAQACYEIGLKDGLTSAMDLEFGTLGSSMAAWYEARDGAARINYGASASVELARALVLDGNRADDVLTAYKTRGGGQGWAFGRADAAQEKDILADLDEGLAAGAIGIGITLGYMPGVSAAQVYAMQALAAQYGRQACVHTRHTPGDATGEVTGVQEILANAAALNAPACINHFNNAGWQNVQALLSGMREKGMNVWGDIYPYVAGSTSINAQFFRPEIFEDKLGWKYEERLFDPALNRFLSKAEYLHYAKTEPVRAVIIYKSDPSEIVDWLQLDGVVIASDGMPVFGAWNKVHDNLPNTHPRRAGTRARALRMARENDLDLSQLIAALSSNAAVYLGAMGLEAMQERGRIQAGMIADITIFDAATITDHASYQDGLQLSSGIHHVLVNGETALRDGAVVDGVKAGQAIRFQPKNSD